MAIKFIDPNATRKIVSMSDEAINKTECDMVEYQRTYDFNMLKFHEGQQPTIFIIKNLPSPKLVEIQQDHYVTELPQIAPGQDLSTIKDFKPKVTAVKTGEMLIKYFKYGVVKIINEGKEIPLTDDLLDTIPANIIQEIGANIMTASILGADKKK